MIIRIHQILLWDDAVDNSIPDQDVLIILLTFIIQCMKYL